MAEKLQNKKELKPKEVKKTLTFEQKIALLEEEKKHWKECWNVMIDKFEEFFPLKKFKESLDDIPKKDIRDVIYQYLYEAVDKVDEEFKKRKTNILNQMPPEQRWEWDWNQLQKEKADWEKERAETLKKIDEHYKTHKGGGMYYRWFDADCYHMEQYLAQKEQKLRERGRQLDKLKLLNDEFERLKKEEEFAKAKSQEPHLVKASLKPVEEQNLKNQKPLKNKNTKTNEQEK